MSWEVENANAVKFSIKVVTSTSGIIGTICSILCLMFTHDIAYFFMSNEAIAKAVSSLSVVLALSILLNGVQPVLSGVAIGSGRQGMVAYINIITYYLIGFPLGIFLCFMTDLAMKGIWVAMLTGVVCQMIVLGFITLRTDWDDQVNKASNRLKIWLLKPSKEASNQSSYNSNQK